jgi:hypothetical protein
MLVGDGDYTGYTMYLQLQRIGERQGRLHAQREAGGAPAQPRSSPGSH